MVAPPLRKLCREYRPVSLPRAFSIMVSASASMRVVTIINLLALTYVRRGWFGEVVGDEDKRV